MILNDSYLVTQIGNLVPSGFVQPSDWYSKDSPTQPASLDLTVGQIFLPCTEDQNKHGLPQGETQHVLEPGRTAIVLTREELQMPDDLVAIGFPPSKVSVQGFLMTNPGQVDPGYRGRLRFTVINMGRKKFVLREGDPIVSLIFNKMTEPAHSGWLARHSGHPGGPITWENLNRVSSDFLSVESRAKEIAEKAIKDADLRIKKAGLAMTLLAVLIPLVVNGLLSFWGPGWKDPLQKVQQDVAVLQSEKDVNQVNKEIHDLQDQIKALPQKLPESSAPPKQ